MDGFRITGGKRLSGRIRVDGSKNAALPQIAAALMAKGPVQLRNLPRLSDIDNMVRLMKELGCEVEHDGSDLRLETPDDGSSHARYDIVKTMRVMRVLETRAH